MNYLWLLPIAFCFVLVCVYKRKPNQLSRAEEVFFQQVINAVEDADDVSDFPLEDGKVIGETRRTRFIVAMVALVKSEKGLLRRTEANRLMVQRMVADNMKKHGVRPSHVIKMLPIVINLCFVPTGADILAAKLNSSEAALGRQDEVQAPWWSRVFGSDRRLEFARA
jgi:hypothetical protein